MIEQASDMAVCVCNCGEVDGVGTCVFAFQPHRDVAEIWLQLLLVRIERRVGVVLARRLPGRAGLCYDR